MAIIKKNSAGGGGGGVLAFESNGETTVGTREDRSWDDLDVNGALLRSSCWPSLYEKRGGNACATALLQKTVPVVGRRIQNG